MSPGMVGNVRVQSCKDCTVVTLHFAAALRVVRCCEVILYRHDPRSVARELRCRTTTVVYYELLWRTKSEHPSAHEVAGYFSCGESIHWHRPRHLTEPVTDDEKVLILSLSLDELPEVVDQY